MTTQEQSTPLTLNPSFAACWRRLTRSLLVFGATVFLASPAQAAGFDPRANYPALPDLPGADIEGQARILVHLDQGRRVVEIEGDFYELDDRALELGFAGLDVVTVVFVLDEASGAVFVLDDGLGTQTYSYELEVFDGFFDPNDLSEGFKIAALDPRQPAPTIPDIVIPPTEDDPEPN